ncbi:MAG: LemA family protein [Deltaproteobacteria bacterium]|nr:LemA family protein [Deltaproteobacteria bacterium]
MLLLQERCPGLSSNENVLQFQHSLDSTENLISYRKGNNGQSRTLNACGKPLPGLLPASPAGAGLAPYADAAEMKKQTSRVEL